LPAGSEPYLPMPDRAAPAYPETGTGGVERERMYFMRGPWLDFSERDRALLTLLRPHLQQAYLENIYEKLGVSSRTAAVTRALADRIA
jgi:hypothetical protein